LPSTATWTSSNGEKKSILDLFLSKTCSPGQSPLGIATASESPDARHDHLVVSASLVDEIVSPLPALDDMLRPVLLRMGAFQEKREAWAKSVEERIGAIPELPQLDILARLERIKAAALSVAQEVLGTTWGKLRSPIRFHSQESILLMLLVRTVKAARRDTLSRKNWHSTTLSPEITFVFLGGPTFFLRV
jgi:hypothetical protein